MGGCAGHERQLVDRSQSTEASIVGTASAHMRVSDSSYWLCVGHGDNMGEWGRIRAAQVRTMARKFDAAASVWRPKLHTTPSDSATTTGVGDGGLGERGIMAAARRPHGQQRVKSQRRGTAAAGTVVAGKGGTVALTHHNQNRNHAQRQHRIKSRSPRRFSAEVGPRRRWRSGNTHSTCTCLAVRRR